MGKSKTQELRKRRQTFLWGALATLVACNLVSWENWTGLADSRPSQAAVWIILIWVSLPLLAGLIIGWASDRLAKSERSKLFLVLTLSLITGISGRVLAPVWGAVLFLVFGLIANLISSVATYFN
jgi:sugar phosphate permease